MERKKLDFNLNFLNTADDNVKDQKTSNESIKDLHTAESDNLNKTKSDLPKEKENLDKTNKEEYSQSEKGCFIFVGIIFVIIIVLCCITFIGQELEKQRELKINNLKNVAYEYKIERNKEYTNIVENIAKLSKQSTEDINAEINNRFNQDKKEKVRIITKKIVEFEPKDEKLVKDCLEKYFDGNKKSMNDAITAEINSQKDNIIKQLVNEWKNKTVDFESHRDKYLKTLFQGDIKEFNNAMDKKLGYKEFSLVEYELPPSGIIHNYTNQELVAPFKIATQRNNYSDYDDYSTKGDNYYIKLVDKYTRKTAVIIFVRSGDEIKVKVPLGLYNIQYAAGDKWYGEKDLFGHTTSYSKSNEDLHFYINGYYVEGHSLILYKVANGNFQTQSMKPEDF